MKIKCNTQNLTIRILEQENRIKDKEFYSTDGIEVGISLFPEAFYSTEQDLAAIYLQGESDERDNKPLEFHNLSDFILGIRAIEQYCATRKWDFKSNFNIERVLLQ